MSEAAAWRSGSKGPSSYWGLQGWKLCFVFVKWAFTCKTHFDLVTCDSVSWHVFHPLPPSRFPDAAFGDEIWIRCWRCFRTSNKLLERNPSLLQDHRRRQRFSLCVSFINYSLWQQLMYDEHHLTSFNDWNLLIKSDSKNSADAVSPLRSWIRINPKNNNDETRLWWSGC